MLGRLASQQRVDVDLDFSHASAVLALPEGNGSEDHALLSDVEYLLIFLRPGSSSTQSRSPGPSLKNRGFLALLIG